VTWHVWADQLRRMPNEAVDELLRGSAEITPFERVAPHEFLHAVLPRDARVVSSLLLGESRDRDEDAHATADLAAHLDAGLTTWLLSQRERRLYSPRKLDAHVAQICEALQLPLYFSLPQTRAALRDERAQWIKWLSALSLSEYRDPEYEYWQLLASDQDDDSLQFLWQSFILEAGRTRSTRFLNLGLLALARLPLSEEDSLRNLRLQVQSLINRYRSRRNWGTAALEDLSSGLREVMGRNPSLNSSSYRALLTELAAPIGEHVTASLLAAVGLSGAPVNSRFRAPAGLYKLKSPGSAEDTIRALERIRSSSSLAHAWQVLQPLVSANEDFMRRSGDYYDFVRALDRCARALFDRYGDLKDPEVVNRIYHWVQLALQVDSENPRLWMLWELTLRQTGHSQRAQWVLWEMSRRFPENVQCRVELARLLADSPTSDGEVQARRLLEQVLQMDPSNLHAHSTLTQLSIRRKDWKAAIESAKSALEIDPSNARSALLLASARSRRGEEGDLQAAIDQLQLYVGRYPGQAIVQGYLAKLLQRQQSARLGRRTAPEEEEPLGDSVQVQDEKHPAWVAFEESVREWLVTLASELYAGEHEQSLPSSRVLPLPKALREAVSHGQWESDLLDRYEPSVTREFPLETRLWRYLQELQSRQTTDAERNRAKQALRHWVEAEIRAPKNDDPLWPAYLEMQWANLNPDDAPDSRAGSEWLIELLDRYQPLPAPLLV
jgi:cytochrome c-type biogenesis protein CcmH/NrfG